jgi:hypothetical protein
MGVNHLPWRIVGWNSKDTQSGKMVMRHIGGNLPKESRVIDLCPFVPNMGNLLTMSHSVLLLKLWCEINSSYLLFILYLFSTWVQNDLFCNTTRTRRTKWVAVLGAPHSPGRTWAGRMSARPPKWTKSNTFCVQNRTPSVSKIGGRVGYALMKYTRKPTRKKKSFSLFSKILIFCCFLSYDTFLIHIAFNGGTMSSIECAPKRMFGCCNIY